MLKLSFHQTEAEIMVRAAATLLFNALVRAGCPLVPLSDLAENPQYGFTASATSAPVGPKFVRITDLQDANIDWDAVPYCDCHDPSKYLLEPYDVLFARTGATTGKTHLVGQCPRAVFASYLIRLRPKPTALAEYLYSFFQSDNYWSQISDSKEGSAQPNVNGRKLMNVAVPSVGSHLQSAVREFLKAVRDRQEGLAVSLPELPPPLDEQRRIVARIEELAAKIEQAQSYRQAANAQTASLYFNMSTEVFERVRAASQSVCLGELTSRVTKGESPEWQGFSYQEGGPVFVRSENVLWGRLDLTNSVHIPSAFHAKLSRSQLFRGDVLINLVGASIGRSAVYDGQVEEANVNQAVAVITPKANDLDSRYLMRFLNSGRTQQIIHGGKVETARPNISLGDLRALSIPLPTLAEQRGIVTHLDCLQAELDTLKNLQFETAAELDALMPSLLSKAFRGEL